MDLHISISSRVLAVWPRRAIATSLVLAGILYIAGYSVSDAGSVTRTYTYTYRSYSYHGSTGGFSYGGGGGGASCDPGYGICPDGTCAPLGNVCCPGGTNAPPGSICCGNGTHCSRGQICVADGCLDVRSKRVCADLTYCNAGSICTNNDKCLPVGSPRVCSDLTYCNAGTICTDSDECLPLGSPRVCSNLTYCEAGSVCTAGNQCKTAAAAEQDQQEAHRRLSQPSLPPAPRVVQGRLSQPSLPPSPSSCSDITGTGGGSAPSNCVQSLRGPVNIQTQITQLQPVSPSPPKVVVVPLPVVQCNLCEVASAALDLAEKLNNLGPESIPDPEAPLFNGGPSTLRPYLSSRPLPTVTEPDDPFDELDKMKDIADDTEALSDLADQAKGPDDYAQKCEDSFLGAAWKAFTAKEGSYREKAKAAEDSLKTCWKVAFKHIEDTIANGGEDPNASSEVN